MGEAADRLATEGPIGTRPREGFSPTSPHQAAGIRIEPPPSLACAIGTARDATSAAAPPLDPPGPCSGFHGLRVGPCTAGAVSMLNANSGVALRTSETSPAAWKRPASVASRRATKPSSMRLPNPSGRPASGSVSLTANGTPPSGPSSAAVASSYGPPTTAFSSGSTASIARRAASRTSLALTAPAPISRRSSVASQAP